jgi:hypothetical protein
MLNYTVDIESHVLTKFHPESACFARTSVGGLQCHQPVDMTIHTKSLIMNRPLEAFSSGEINGVDQVILIDLFDHNCVPWRPNKQIAG